MDFGEAIRELEKGNCVARAGWNGKGMWIVLINEDDEYSEGYKWCPFVALKTAQDKIIPWNASQADMLAKDWTLVSH